MNLLKDTGIPVPRMIFSCDDYLIESFLEGKLLTENEPLDSYATLGKYVRIMHSVKRSGYGEIQSSGNGKFKTEIEHMAYFMPQTNIQYEDNKILAKLKMPEVFIKNLHILDSSSSSLIHADIKNDNVLSNGVTITGLIDFGDSVAGAPEYDLGWYYIHTEKEAVWEAFLYGYGKDYNIMEELEMIRRRVPRAPK